jgi:CBS domain-containing protein
MPDSVIKATVREIEPLGADEPVGSAAAKVIDAGLPALPVVDENGKFAGIFGEREFMAALFPGYLGELAHTAMVSRSIDETIERRVSCREEPVANYLTTDHVLVEDDYSDTQLAELFLHHRVLIIPIATSGRVHGVVTRNDFFRELADRLRATAEDQSAQSP